MNLKTTKTFIKMPVIKIRNPVNENHNWSIKLKTNKTYIKKLRQWIRKKIIKVEMSITKSVKLYFFNEREKYEKNKKSLIAPKLVTNKDIRWTNRKIREHGGSFNNMVS